MSNITVQDTELNNVIHSVDYELLMGERIFTTNISEINKTISSAMHSISNDSSVLNNNDLNIDEISLLILHENHYQNIS